MKLTGRIGLGLVLLILLVLVRQYEFRFFYDPLMAFFSNEYRAGDAIPFSWYLNMILRFLINTLLSLGILYLCFRSQDVIKFSALLYGVVFLFLFPAFVILIGEVNNENYLTVFYVRRFLIHPVLLLLLVPAFIYQKMNSRKTS